MYKIVGRLIGGEPTTDGIGIKEIEKTYKAKCKFTLIIKFLYAKFFYDWVKVEEYKEYKKQYSSVMLF